MQSSRNYWKFPLFSGKTVARVELRGEINKVAELKSKLNRAQEEKKIFCCDFYAQPGTSFTNILNLN